MAQFSDLDTKLNTILAFEQAHAGSGVGGPVTQAQFDSLDAKAASIIAVEQGVATGPTGPAGSPAIPVSVSTAQAVPSGVSIVWASVPGAVSYNVKRSVTSNQEATVGTATAPATTFTDASVVPGTLYFYVVSAVSAIGESANSAEVSIIA